MTPGTGPATGPARDWADERLATAVATATPVGVPQELPAIDETIDIPASPVERVQGFIPAEPDILTRQAVDAYLLPAGVYLLADTETLEISCRPGSVLAAVDFDGTCAATEEVLFSGCNSIGARICEFFLYSDLFAHGVQEHLLGEGRTLAPTMAQEWETGRFRECCGHGITRDAEFFAKKLTDEYGVTVSADTFRKALQYYVHEVVAELAPQVSVVPGIKNLLSTLRQMEASLALCTASPHETVNPILLHHELDQFFHQTHFEVVKKNGNGFKGDTLSQIHDALCADRGLKVQDVQRNTIVIGDTVSDVGFGALAKAKMVIVYLDPRDTSPGPEGKFNRRLEDLLTKIELNLNGNHGPHVSGEPHHTSVVIVRNLGQVTVKPGDVSELSWDIQEGASVFEVVARAPVL